MRGRTNAMSGTVLPELSNPAGAANIQSGYQAINGAGEVVTGTASMPQYVTGRFSGDVYSGNIYGVGPDGLIENKSFTSNTTVSIQKNSIIVIKYLNYSSVNGGISFIETTETSGGIPYEFFSVTDDFTINY